MGSLCLYYLFQSTSQQPRKIGYLKQILILLKHVEGLHISIQIQSKLVPKIYKAVQIQTSDGLPTNLISQPCVHYASTTLTSFHFFYQRLAPLKKIKETEMLHHGGSFPKDLI